MPEEKLQTLSLQVINGSELESGRAARCLFTQQGNVGHGPECHWSVQDRQQSIPAQAFTVILHDGTFCLAPADGTTVAESGKSHSNIRPNTVAPGR